MSRIPALTGIGLDDAFIITGAFDRTDPRKDVVDRIHETFEEVGLSIAMTTATTTLAFGLGCVSNIPAMVGLSLYACPAVIFDFLYQITFFVAIIVLDDRRSQANRMDCCICVKVEQITTDATVNDRDDDGKPIAHDHLSHKFMAWYARQLLRPWVKVIVVASFIAFAVASFFSTTKLTKDFKVSGVVPEDSYMLRFFDALDDYGQRGSVTPTAYFRNVNQSDPHVQNQMEDFINDLVSMDQIEFQPPFFWLRDFKQFTNTTARVYGLPFNRQLAAFLDDPGYQRTYGSSIMLDKDGSIESSRCVLYMTNLNMDDTNAQIRALYDQRNVASSQPTNQGLEAWNFFTFENSYYIWEFFDVAGKEVMMTTALGIISVSALGFAFIPHWSAVFFIFPLITILSIDLLGMYLQQKHSTTLRNIKDSLFPSPLLNRIPSVLRYYHQCRKLYGSDDINWSFSGFHHACSFEIL